MPAHKKMQSVKNDVNARAFVLKFANMLLFYFCFFCRWLIVNQNAPIPHGIHKTYRLFAHLWLTYFLMFTTYTNANSMRQQVRDKHIEFGKVSLMLMSDLVLNQNIFARAIVLLFIQTARRFVRLFFQMLALWLR